MVHEKKQYKYVLTPKRKKIGKAIARRNMTRAVHEVFQNPVMYAQVLIKLGIVLRKELKVVCSDKVNSVLRCGKIKEFTWSELKQNLSDHALTLLSILYSCTKTKTPRGRDNRLAVIGTVAAILMKYRNLTLSVLHKIISLILYAGHSSAQVIRVISTMYLSK